MISARWHYRLLRARLARSGRVSRKGHFDNSPVALAPGKQDLDFESPDGTAESRSDGVARQDKKVDQPCRSARVLTKPLYPAMNRRAIFRLSLRDENSGLRVS